MSSELAKTQMDEAILEKIVTKGDVSGLSPADRATYYIHLCKSLGLNPATQPIDFITFQGKTIAYFKRGATDQLAANHRVNRKVLEGPEVKKIGNQDIVYCKVLASLPDGRSEEDIGTLHLRDPAMDLMKCLTKSKRRATLSILGLGMPDESEIADMPGATVAQAVVTPATRVDEVAGDTPVPQVILDDIQSAGGAPLTTDTAATILLDHRCLMRPEEIAVSFRHLVDVSGGNGNALKRSIQLMEWLGQVDRTDKVEALRELYTKAKAATEDKHSPWTKRDAPEALARLEQRCKERKEKLTQPEPPPGGPGGSPEPEAPVAEEDDPERAAIQLEGNGLAAEAKAPDEVTRLRAALADITDLNHLANHIAEGLHTQKYKLLPEILRAIGEERFWQLGISKMGANNRITEASQKYPTRKARSVA